MIACVQEIVELSDFFRILIISQQEIDLSQDEDVRHAGRGMAGDTTKRPLLNDENEEYPLAKRARGDFTPKRRFYSY